ncbi:MAG TPA: ECF transporter S component [Candidatus Pseudogracilibacillus intestinigallinarum]|uniref:Riboflavin transporter n=1 Tax=Candidatus Pseudogracilibacillus intestinigallinarum TaxID=2838742 RepID=A0A9D1PMF8_9BACI|nr:ECF transporter S component [Candidatus Pseudogracilibacillus intestinigallinarum]
MQKSQSSSKLLKLVVLSLLATMSLVLFFISFPLPLLPPYLKVDFSDIPALIAGMIFSPAAGVLVVFLKNLMYFVAKGATDPVGVVANFIAGTLYVFPVAYLYRKYSGINSIVIGLTIGTVVMAVVMTILNYFIILPAYGMFVGVGFTDTAKWIAVIGGVLPFNFIKGVIVSILFVPLFFKLKEWIEKKKVPTSAA